MNYTQRRIALFLCLTLCIGLFIWLVFPNETPASRWPRKTEAPDLQYDEPAEAMEPGNPNVICAGTGQGTFAGSAVRGAGIFKTTDGGATWARLPETNNLDFHYVNDIVISTESFG